ncbi:MAG TPA: pyridoxamine 5'-phosphate oxidase [Gaiellaceae bacterium]|nr:pyridoxamine 5'-phosphate oxidase [Gaiellaceae bacterium]
MDLTDLHSDPLVQFRRWFQAARAEGIELPEAMTLATATPDGRPSARTVLLKGVDKRGFLFFTNYESRKGLELAANPHAALVFHWPQAPRRQVTAAGAVERLPAAESEEYFGTRPLGSRLGAWASRQSEPLPGREALEAALAAAEERYGDEPPLPPWWGGYVLRPERVELWENRPNRLHDRFRYTRRGDAWDLERLAP